MRRQLSSTTLPKSHIASTTTTHCTKLIKHNASRLSLSCVSIHPPNIYFLRFLLRLCHVDPSSIETAWQRAHSKLRTYGRFDALVARQFTISLLNLWWALTSSLCLNAAMQTTHTSLPAQMNWRLCAVRCALCMRCVLSLEGDNQCGVRNWQKASCDNNCHYYPFKYLSVDSWCVFAIWLRSDMHTIEHMNDALTPSHACESIHHSNGPNGFMRRCSRFGMRVDILWCCCGVCRNTSRRWQLFVREIAPRRRLISKRPKDNIVYRLMLHTRLRYVSRAHGCTHLSSVGYTSFIFPLQRTIIHFVATLLLRTLFAETPAKILAQPMPSWIECALWLYSVRCTPFRYSKWMWRLSAVCMTYMHIYCSCVYVSASIHHCFEAIPHEMTFIVVTCFMRPTIRHERCNYSPHTSDANIPKQIESFKCIRHTHCHLCSVCSLLPFPHVNKNT